MSSCRTRTFEITEQISDYQTKEQRKEIRNVLKRVKYLQFYFGTLNVNAGPEGKTKIKILRFLPGTNVVVRVIFYVPITTKEKMRAYLPLFITGESRIYPTSFQGEEDESKRMIITRPNFSYDMASLFEEESAIQAALSDAREETREELPPHEPFDKCPSYLRGDLPDNSPDTKETT